MLSWALCLQALVGRPPVATPAPVAAPPVPTVRRAFVLTHQIDALMDATERRLLGAEWEGSPVVLLRADHFGRLTPALLERADLVYEDTPTALPFETGEVHVAGGYADLCLHTTVQHLLRALLNESRRTLELVVHADLTYIRGRRTLWEQFDQGSREMRLAHAASSAARQFFQPWDRRWRPCSLHPDDHHYTDGTHVVNVRAVAD